MKTWRGGTVGGWERFSRFGRDSWSEKNEDWRGGAGRGAAKSDGAAVVVKWEENPREARLLSEWVRSAPSDQWATFFTLSIYTEFAKYTSFYLSIIHYTPFLKKYTPFIFHKCISGITYTYSINVFLELWFLVLEIYFQNMYIFFNKISLKN